MDPHGCNSYGKDPQHPTNYLNFSWLKVLQKEVARAPHEPIFKYGLVRVKYGVSTGSVRVRETRGFLIKPRVFKKKYGLIRGKYGVNTGSIRVQHTPKSQPELFFQFPIKTTTVAIKPNSRIRCLNIFGYRKHPQKCSDRLRGPSNNLWKLLGKEWFPFFWDVHMFATPQIFIQLRELSKHPQFRTLMPFH